MAGMECSGFCVFEKKKYKAYVLVVVREKCWSFWCSDLARHCTPMDYLAVKGSASVDLSLGRLSLPWHSLQLQRSVSRLKANLIRLRHLHGRRSAARRQHCIFCEEATLSVAFHVLCRCPKSAELQRMFWEFCEEPQPESQHGQVLKLFQSGPGMPHYEVLLAWAGSVDKGARDFWGGDV